MKTKTIINLMITLLPTIGCSDFSNELSDNPNEITKSENNNVSIEEIKRLIDKSALTRTAVEETTKIVCVKNAENDTLLFLCDEKDDGWTIYSTDTRVPPILAQCETGRIADLLNFEPAMSWINSMAKDMEKIKKTDDSKLTFSSIDIEKNKNFWLSVSDPVEYLEKRLAQKSKFNQPSKPSDFPPLLPKGHYEYASTIKVEEVYDSIPHLIQTHWHQQHPYNVFCPYKSFGATNEFNKSPAGCVAIAGAQMLYFLHFLFGVPTSAPSKAYCHGKNTDKDYNWYQYEFNSTIWDNMNDYIMDSDSYTIYHGAAPLIANVGKRVGLTYGDYQTTGNTYKLVSTVFNPYGINCKFVQYDEGKLKLSLISGMPVIMRASSLQSNMEGHTFIVDRYKRSTYTIITTYQWVYDEVPKNDDGSDVLIPYIEDKVEISYTSPEITMIGMNWGYGESKDYGWYTLSGDWVLSGDNYKEDRYMIIDFSK